MGKNILSKKFKAEKIGLKVRLYNRFTSSIDQDNTQETHLRRVTDAVICLIPYLTVAVTTLE
ncbi:MAG: hypothetical protein WBQ25_06755 [Nitrososphaeraceae archaeon]